MHIVQEPIILELYGIFCGQLAEVINMEDVLCRLEHLEENVEDHFNFYLKNVTTAIKDDLPTFSLSSSFIDFGSGVESESEFCLKRMVQTFSLTNHLQCDLYIVWEIGKYKLVKLLMAWVS